MAETTITFGRKRIAAAMTQSGPLTQSGHDNQKLIRAKRIKFGTVTVSVDKPNEAELLSNVRYSTEALKRMGATGVKVGITIRTKKDVPLYHADELDPRTFIRKLNGKIERGVLEDGVFKVTS